MKITTKKVSICVNQSNPCHLCPNIALIDLGYYLKN